MPRLIVDSRESRSGLTQMLAQRGAAMGVFSATPEQLRAVACVGPKTITAMSEVLEFETREFR
ncbi:hypothetical protein LJR290_007654 [Variovorax sp. LjRoot290]|uniref:hypothetical protein n=1 Tax=Variovorax sp. LjRoot290 TaxID=3342316 RepID=UPI003ED05F79